MLNNSISVPPAPANGRIPFSRQIRIDVWSMTDGRCFYCGLRTNPFITFCIDHVYPVSRGGSNDIGNLVPCCRYCNASKRDSLLDDWSNNRKWYLSDEFRNGFHGLREWTIREHRMARLGLEWGDIPDDDWPVWEEWLDAGADPDVMPPRPEGFGR
jgi:hypothetical protein